MHYNQCTEKQIFKDQLPLAFCSVAISRSSINVNYFESGMKADAAPIQSERKLAHLDNACNALSC